MAATLSAYTRTGRAMFLRVRFTHVLEGVGQLVSNLIAHCTRDAEAAGLGQRFQSCSDVDAVAVDVAAIGNDVAEVDPDAEGDAFVLGCLGVAVDHRPLDLDRTPDRIHDARKFHQHAVAGRLDDAPAVLPDLRVDKLAAMLLQAVESALLVRPHQP